MEYNLANPAPITLSLPEIEFNPVDCFTVVDYLVIDESGEIPNYVSIYMSSSTFIIYITDPDMGGKTVKLHFTAIVNDKTSSTLEFEDENELRIEIIDACVST